MTGLVELAAATASDGPGTLRSLAQAVGEWTRGYWRHCARRSHRVAGGGGHPALLHLHAIALDPRPNDREPLKDPHSVGDRRVI